MRIIAPMEKTALTKEMRSIREALGVSQRVMADMIGTNRNIYADYELGRTRLPADIYIKVKSLAPKTFRVKNRAGDAQKP